MARLKDMRNLRRGEENEGARQGDCFGEAGRVRVDRVHAEEILPSFSRRVSLQGEDTDYLSFHSVDGIHAWLHNRIFNRLLLQMMGMLEARGATGEDAWLSNAWVTRFLQYAEEKWGDDLIGNGKIIQRAPRSHGQHRAAVSAKRIARYLCRMPATVSSRCSSPKARKTQ